MIAKERYNSIVYKIEELVLEAEYMSDHEISKKAFAAASSYIEDREKNSIFLFLMGCSVIEYIRERRMMAAYKCLISSEKPLYQKAIDLSGVQNQASFIKKFKKYFGITPRDAFKIKDETRIEPLKDWNLISNDGKEIFTQFNDNNNVLQELKFGISKEMYIRAKYAENLQSFYKLNDLEAEFAFQLSESYTLTMEDTFEYVYNYVWSYIENEVLLQDEELAKRDKRIREDLLNDDTLYLYFDCGFSFEDIYMLFLLKQYNCMEKSMREYDIPYLQGYLRYMRDDYWRLQVGLISKEDIFSKYKRYEEAYQYFQKHKTNEYTQFDYFLYNMLVSKFGLICLAWERIKPGNRNMSQVHVTYENICKHMQNINVVDAVANQKTDKARRLQEELDRKFFEKDEEFYDELYCDEEDYMDDLDDPDYNQDLYMAFDENVYLFEDESDFNEEYFEQLCDLEEKGQLNERRQELRGLYVHLDLNVEEDFENN